MALEDHFSRIGENPTTTSAMNSLYSNIVDHVNILEEEYLKNCTILALSLFELFDTHSPLDCGVRERAMLSSSLVHYRNLITEFHKSLYRRRHPFYFRGVKKWEEHLKVIQRHRETSLILLLTTTPIPE